MEKNGATTKAPTPKTSKRIALRDLEIVTTTIPIVGTDRLVVHKFSEKDKDKIRKSQAGTNTRAGKGKREPEKEWLEALYVMPSCGVEAGHPDASYGFPSVAFKKAMVRAAKSISGMTMVDSNGQFFVLCDESDDKGFDLSLIQHDEPPVMREDSVRLSSGVTSLAYRPEFAAGWRIDLKVQYNEAAITAEMLVNLANIAGFSVGVGENRPEKKGGSWGRFQVAV